MISSKILELSAVPSPPLACSLQLPLPTTIYVHEYLTVDGRKISKSLGNAVDPVALAARFGADVVRHWLLREVPRGEDADFTVERLVGRANADLANGLGNLLNRTVTMIRRWRGGVIPSPGPAGASEQALRALVATLPARIGAALDDFDFRAAMSAVWELVVAANRYVDETAPWSLAKRANGGAI